MEDKSLYDVWLSIFNKTGLTFENTITDNALTFENTSTDDALDHALVDNVIIEVEEGIDLIQEWEELIVEPPENEFNQQIFQNKRKINIIQNIMLTAPKTDELNDKTTEEYLKTKTKEEKVREEQGEIKVVAEETDNKKINTDNIEKIEERIEEKNGEIRDESNNSKAGTENIEIDLVNGDSSTRIQKKKDEDENIVAGGKNMVYQKSENKEIEELKEKQNNEIGETVAKTTIDKIKNTKKVEKTEEETGNENKQVLKTIENISPPRTKENMDKNSNLTVPSPFKKALFWPEPTPSKKFLGKRKEKIPSVTTSEAWKEYYSKKEEEKNKQLEEKENRKRQRIEKSQSRKRHKNAKPQPQNLSENIVLINARENDDKLRIDKVKDLRNLKIGDFVIVSFENSYYPGNVTGIEKEKILVSAMTRIGCNWKWPNEKDEIWYDNIEIMEVIQPPKKINKRGHYQVEEIAKYG